MTDSPDGPWRIGIAGAGAMGTTLAVRFALAGHSVNVVARGATLAAIQADGMGLTDLSGAHHVTVQAGTAAEFGAQDVLFLCAKAQDLITLAAVSAPMIGPQTLIVPVVNGIPFWYFEKLGGRHEGRTVRAVDPDGRLRHLLPLDQVIGAVAFITAERTRPNHAVTANPLRMIIGELCHQRTDRIEGLAQMMRGCGIATDVSERLRDPLWTKVIANLTSNPLSVVAGATLRDIYSDPWLVPLARQMLDEALLTAAAHGARVELDPTSFLAMGASMGEVKTSMLQDYEKGLPLELSSIGEAVLELAEAQGLSLPLTRNILSLARYKSTKGLREIRLEKEKS